MTIWSESSLWSTLHQKITHNKNHEPDRNKPATPADVELVETWTEKA